MEKHPLHLKNKELQTSREVKRAVAKAERKSGEKIPNDPSDRIEVYMERLSNTFLRPNVVQREGEDIRDFTERERRAYQRNLRMFRNKIYAKLIIKKENFPESYFELQRRVARERGQVIEDVSADVREQMMDTAIEDQRASLDAWIDYLASPDAVYPAWFKYYVWNQIIKLSQFDKERGEFKKRTDSTVAPFPDIYREPLAQIADLYERVKDDNKNLEARPEFDKRFPTLYAELVTKSLAAALENREQVSGQWVKYEQGDSTAAQKLFESLEGKGTGWCTAGRSTAQAQIESGDFYVYYTNDTSGNPTQPRLAIRMEGKKKIGEVRGILPHQGVEPLMQGVLDEKFQEFGAEADAYRKKSEDMRHLTALERKRESGQVFDKDDLVFLYELNSTIESFGYEKDPRIDELRQGRNPEEDMLAIFECTREQVAHIPSQINENTKAYVGQLEPGIFQRLPENLEHVYTSFPDKKIRRENLEIGVYDFGAYVRELESAGITDFSDYREVKMQFESINKTQLSKKTKEFVEALISIGINISDYAKSMLKNKEFVPSKNPEEATLIRLTVADLGFKRMTTTDQVYERAQILGLELCPADTGPNYRLKYRNPPLNEWIYVGMKQISVSGGDQSVFKLFRNSDSLWLDDSRAWSSVGWDPIDEFVFRLR